MFVLKAFKHWANTAKMMPFGALRASPPSSTYNNSKHLSLDLFSTCLFWNVAFDIRFSKQRDVTHSKLYTEQFCAHMLVHRFLRTGQLLHSETFTHWCTKMLVHSAAFTPRPLYTQKLLHRETFAQNSFYTKKFSSPPLPKPQKKAKSVFPVPAVSLPDNACCNGRHWDIQIYPGFFVCPLDSHSAFYMTPCSTLFYRQTPLRTAAFTQRSFYPHMFLHREVCAQRNFYTQTVAALRPNLQCCCLNACPSFLLPTFCVPLPKLYLHVSVFT